MMLEEELDDEEMLATSPRTRRTASATNVSRFFARRETETMFPFVMAALPILCQSLPSHRTSLAGGCC